MENCPARLGSVTQKEIGYNWTSERSWSSRNQVNNYQTNSTDKTKTYQVGPFKCWWCSQKALNNKELARRRRETRGRPCRKVWGENTDMWSGWVSFHSCKCQGYQDPETCGEIWLQRNIEGHWQMFLMEKEN